VIPVKMGQIETFQNYSENTWTTHWKKTKSREYKKHH
jgi:hypothetical protein